jgi:hypothetical protein
MGVKTDFGRFPLLICADTFRDSNFDRVKRFKPDLMLVLPYGLAATKEIGRAILKYSRRWSLALKRSAEVQFPMVGVDLVGEMSDGPWKGRTYGGASLVAGRLGKGSAGVARSRYRYAGDRTLTRCADGLVNSVERRILGGRDGVHIPELRVITKRVLHPVVSIDKDIMNAVCLQRRGCSLAQVDWRIPGDLREEVPFAAVLGGNIERELSCPRPVFESRPLAIVEDYVDGVQFFARGKINADEHAGPQWVPASPTGGGIAIKCGFDIPRIRRGVQPPFR